MTIFLKQNTASQEILLGPFMSSTDGLTPKTGLSIASTDINIWKAGSTSLTTCSAGASEIGTGNYSVVLAAADTDTLGTNVLYVKPSGALLIRLELAVLPANVYDSWFGSDIMDVSVTQWNGTNVHAPGTAGVPLVDIHDAASATIGTVTAVGTVTTLTNLPAVTDDWLTAAGIKADAVTKIQNGLATPTNITAGTITTATNLTNLPAVTADWLTAAGIKADAVTKIQNGLATPTNITAGTITTATNVTTVNGIANGAITADTIADNAIDLATFAADVKTGSALKANVETISNNAVSAAAIDAAAVTKIQNGLATPTNITAGTITTLTNLPSCPADWITADGVKADAVTKIQAGLATPTNIVSGTITTVTNLTNLPAAAATAIELAKVPKSDGSVSWNATALNAIQGECTDALNAYDPPTNAEMEARTIAAASYFDPAADTVAHVTLVDTCTTNTDMRGTNSAALASVCTEARLAELDAANLPADIAAVDTAVDAILPFTYRHYKITGPVFDANHNMTSCTVTRYPTKADKVADTNGKVYNVVATYTIAGDLATYSEEGAV